MFVTTPDKYMAGGTSCGVTTSGNAACHVGIVNVAPSDIANVTVSNTNGFTRFKNAQAARRSATSVRQDWPIKSRRRRSTTSASAPAGNASRKKGRLEAVCINETSTGESDRCEVISHTVAVSCMEPARLDARNALQIARNVRFPRSRASGGVAIGGAEDMAGA